MAKRTLRKAARLIAAGLLSAAATAGAVVYDNTANLLGFFSQLEADGARADGNEVTLAGTARTIVEFGVVLDGFSDAGPSDLRIRFFSNDAPDGAPQTLLYDSGLATIPLQPTPQLFTFPIPSVVVPDTFTWVMSTGAAGQPRILAPFHSPAVVGAHQPFSWGLLGDFWSPIQPNAVIPDRGYGARIIAVPEPATLLLVSFALFGRRIVR